MAVSLSRPFARAVEDLDIDFARADRPALVTELLVACAAPAEAEFWWQSPVRDRTAALLALLQASEGSDVIRFTQRCDGCGDPFELSLAHADLAQLGREASCVAVARDNGEALVLRLPNGDDLRRWHKTLANNSDGARETMLETLRLSGELLPGDVDRAAEALAAADPLVAFALTSVCPNCSADIHCEFDLEGFALRRLAGCQRSLLCEVHALASHYGWTESEILAVTPPRRAYYLELIEGRA
jgi:hypothetical protein